MPLFDDNHSNNLLARCITIAEVTITFMAVAIFFYSVCRLVAQQIVRISSIDPDEILKNNKIRGSVCRKPMVFDRCRKWLDLIPEEFSDAEKNKRSVALVLPHMALKIELIC